jgi:hypothetical protein
VQFTDNDMPSSDPLIQA